MPVLDLSFHRVPSTASSHTDVAPAPEGFLESMMSAEAKRGAPQGGSEGASRRGAGLLSLSPAGPATPVTACLCRRQQESWGC